MRRVRLDEEDLVVFLTPALTAQGYIAEDHKILGFEYKTKKIKRGGDYYKDGVKDGEFPPEGVDEVVWLKVLVGPSKRRKAEGDEEPAGDDAEAPEGTEGA